MRILMLSPETPWPLDRGSKIRIYHTLKELSCSHDVTLIALAEGTTQDEAESALPFSRHLHTMQLPRQSRLSVTVRSLLLNKTYRAAKFDHPRLKELVAHTLHSQHYDVLWVHFLNMFSHLPPLLRSEAVTILDQHNADELEWESYLEAGNVAFRAFALQNIWKLRRFQDKALRKANVVCSVSESDAAFMRKRVPASCQVWTVPNGVDTEHFFPPSGHVGGRSNAIIFCGSMDITMNMDAVARFAKDIFPLVRKSIPDAEFWIVGRNPGTTTTRLESVAGIRVTGSVIDVRPYYEKARVAVSPFRYGGGTKLKVLEAMALGVPVVATQVGCQGIEAVPGQHLFTEDKSEEFAQRVIDLLRNSDLWRTMSVAARSLVESKYSWTSIMSDAGGRLEKLVEDRLEEGGRADGCT